jgi:hypothetical protein
MRDDLSALRPLAGPMSLCDLHIVNFLTLVTEFDRSTEDINHTGPATRKTPEAVFA